MVMQSLGYYVKKYITGSYEPEVSKVKSTVKNQIAIPGSAYHVETIEPVLLRRIALREPMVYKAILKKNRDTIRNWFMLKTKDGTSVPKKALKLQNEFEKRTSIKGKFTIGGECSNIYGTGFIERTFVENDNISSDVKPSITAEPLSLIPLNSEFIQKIDKHPKKKDGILYYIYKENMSDEKYIHPDRIIAISIDKLPHSPFGISKVDVLLNILKSKMNADVSSGEILSWFGHGILDMTINNMNDEQHKAMLDLYKQHPNYYVHDEDYKLDIKNPTSLDPKPFYDYFYTNIASAFEMPTHILTGMQMGNVTGSEIGISDYYNDIENIQELVFTPIIERIYKQLFISNGLKWDYLIDWNPIYVDELAEARIGQTRTLMSTQNVNAGIISISEARHILNEGVIDLDINKIPEKPKVVNPPIGTEPNIEPQPPVKKPSIKNVILTPLNEEQRRMIQDWRDFCKEEEIAQERRLKEAEERLKKKSKGKKK